ncbi:MAG: ATP-binding protein [Planctomycetaceae bacterium]|nr:response regulator [Planctomycetaceae bacterium]
MTQTLKVLVVDDEPGMRMGVQRALKGLVLQLPEIDGDVAIEVQEADSGEAALEAIAAAHPDILLLDHKLPGISGLDVLERVNGHSEGMLTLMITAYASLETAITATKRGAYDFLAKPFTPEELRAAVRKAAKHLMLQREARRLAQEKRQVRFQFISVVVHELKAPIGAIKGYLQIMKDRTAGNELAAYDHMVDRSMVRLDGMQKLIFDLLDLTRIESGQKAREMTAVDAVAAARDAIEAQAAAAAPRKIVLELHAPPALEMTADRGELDIIFNNLVSNAVKYNRDGGRVDVTLACEGGVVTATVSDTGIGMAQEDVPRLFGEFTRIKNEKTRNITGSGLGLSIVKKLAQLNGGDATVASRLNEGSIFTVTLKQHQKASDA